MNLALCLVSILLIPLAMAGLALIHQGLGRSRSAAHAMLATLAAIAVAAIAFALFGFSFAGYSGGTFHTLTLAGHPVNWLGAELLFAGGVTSDSMDPRAGLALCFGIVATGLTAIIPISTGSDRWRLGSIMLTTAVLAGFVYPLFAHWTWATGWHGQLGELFGLPPMLDLGGAGAIQTLGGLAALSVVWILGPRRGKYSANGYATAIPGHNIVLVMLGCLLALVGWIGLDAAASMIFYEAPPYEILGVVLDAILTASAGLLAALITTRIRYRKPDASISANGWIAGLVAGSAFAGFLSPAAAIFVGLVAGVLVAFLVELLELRLLIDDPGGAISVHAGAGLWGLVAAGLFRPGGLATTSMTLLAQLIGIATLLGLIFPLIHGINLILNRLTPFRVDKDGDWQGMDIRELGAGAYPEFVVHADEFVPR